MNDTPPLTLTILACCVVLLPFVLIYLSKKNPDAFNRGNPFYPGGIKSTKTRRIVLIIAILISITQIIILLIRRH